MKRFFLGPIIMGTLLFASAPKAFSEPVPQQPAPENPNPPCSKQQFEDILLLATTALEQLDAAYQECRKLPINETKCRDLAEKACTTADNYTTGLEYCSLSGWDPRNAALIQMLLGILQLHEPLHLEFVGQPFQCLSRYGYSDMKWWEIKKWAE